MKKIILCVSLGALICAQGFSQNWMVGGDVGFGYKSTKVNGRSNSDAVFSFSPLIGYALTNKIDMGVQLLFKNEPTTFGFAGWGRYHLLGGGAFGVNALGAVGFSNVDRSSSDYKTFFIGLMPNFEYRLGNRVSVYSNIGGIRFTHGWSDSDNGNTDFKITIEDGVTLGAMLRL
ncbi:MAG: hypothetical protein LBH73_01890 [Spirochaetaceae bacterium]|jgi:hypothetical protein|nr:hypothetical protein [Spirochaetaceae bacterium]